MTINIDKSLLSKNMPYYEKHKLSFSIVLNLIKQTVKKVINQPIKEYGYEFVRVEGDEKILETIHYDIQIARWNSDIIVINIKPFFELTVEIYKNGKSIEWGALNNIYIYLSLKDKKITILPCIYEGSIISIMIDYISKIIEDELLKEIPDLKFIKATKFNICNHFCWSKVPCINFIKNIINKKPSNDDDNLHLHEKYHIWCNVKHLEENQKATCWDKQIEYPTFIIDACEKRNK